MTRRRSREHFQGNRRWGRRVSRLPSLKARGFSTMGMGHFWSWLLPSLQGRDRRLFFNELSSSIVLSSGIVGAFLGFELAGLFGALVGFGGGAAAGAAFAVKCRFYRK